MIGIEYACASDIGMMRKENQDAFGKFPDRNDDLACPGGQLFVIADGMGGHKAGREASELAVNILAYYYYEAHGVPAAERLRSAFNGANSHIHSYSVNSVEHAGMGTTCSVLALTPEGAAIGHVGDSRIYRIRGRKIEQLTADHS